MHEMSWIGLESLHKENGSGVLKNLDKKFDYKKHSALEESFETFLETGFTIICDKESSNWHYIVYDNGQDMKCHRCLLPAAHERVGPAWYVLTIKRKNKNNLWKWLEVSGIGVSCHYRIPIRLQGTYKNLGYNKGDFPVAEEIPKTEIDIPIYCGISDEGAQTRRHYE